MLPLVYFWVTKNLYLLTTGLLNYFINGKLHIFKKNKNTFSMKFLEFYDSTFRSVTLVTGCSILVSSNQLFGDPIQCDLVINIFCTEMLSRHSDLPPFPLGIVMTLPKIGRILEFLELIFEHFCS